LSFHFISDPDPLRQKIPDADTLAMSNKSILGKEKG
jgi:hypothetical protein